MTISDGSISGQRDGETLPRGRLAAALLISTLLLFVILNLVVWAGYCIKDSLTPARNQVEDSYHMSLRKYYPGLTQAQIDKLIGETYRPFQYAPYVEFQETPRLGTYVNVDDAGFRRSSQQAPWPPSSNKPAIFIFGGSTTFGYGVRDDDTLVSALTHKLRQEPKYANAQIYNFGRGFYWLAQEHILFETLRMQGWHPDLAIFVDGLNEFARPDDKPQFSSVLSVVFEREMASAGSTAGKFRNLAHDLRDLLRVLPLIRLAQDIRGSLRDQSQIPLLQPYNSDLVGKALESYLQNKALIEMAAEHDHIGTLFVWQPIPSRGYPASLHRDFTAHNGFGIHSQSYYGYTNMQARNEPAHDPHFLWCADIQRQALKPLYVDLVHYNRAGAEGLAGCIADGLKARGM